MDIFSVITLFGGLAMFLYGMNVMGDSLKKLSGGKLEYFLGRLTSNRFKGFLLGFVVTALIQSSSATTVMLVGFVNSGLMRLSQTLGIIMGANVGTTVTAWLLSMSDITGESFILRLLRPSSFTPILIMVGVLMNITAKSDKKKDIASILIGFSILMFGMETMSSSMSALKDDPRFTHILVMFQNPILGILSGLILTAIIQSSSASVGILQALSATGAISFATAIPIILGQNIGAAVPTVLSSINGNSDSKRVAAACVYIKILGVIVVCIIFYLLHSMLNFAFMEMNVNAFTIAIVHTTFNILATVVLIPFCHQIEWLSEKTIKHRKDETSEFDDIDMLDDRFLSLPSFAVEKCHELTYHMAQISERSINMGTELLYKYDRAAADKIKTLENKVDKYEDKLSAYLVALAAKSLNNSDSIQVTNLLHIIGDIERISDHALNISESAQEISSKKIEFSADAMDEIKVLTTAVNEIISITTSLLEHNDIEKAKSVEPLEQIIDKLKLKIKDNHIKRLREGECTVEMGFILSDILNNYERVADHCSNIAISILGSANNLFEAHDYSNHIKNDGENEFFEKYDYFKKKYMI